MVNGQAQAADQGQALMPLYGPIPAGRFWHDPLPGRCGDHRGLTSDSNCIGYCTRAERVC